MRRGTFALTLGAAVIATCADPFPFVLRGRPGESVRFPGHVLRAYADPYGEVYLAYSKAAVCRVSEAPDPFGALFSDEDIHELESNVVFSNAPTTVTARSCDGRCGDDADHDCFRVGDQVAKWTAYLADPAHAMSNTHPNELGMVAQLWTYYA